jgi:hypothetical protein
MLTHQLTVPCFGNGSWAVYLVPFIAVRSRVGSVKFVGFAMCAAMFALGWVVLSLLGSLCVWLLAVCAHMWCVHNCFLICICECHHLILLHPV